jgi:hypothetical protein
MPRQNSSGPHAKARAADSGFGTGQDQGHGVDTAVPSGTTDGHGVEPPRMAFRPGMVEAWRLDQFYRRQDLPRDWRVQPDAVQARAAASSLGMPVQDICASTCLSLPDLGCCWCYHEAWRRFADAERPEVRSDLDLLQVIVESTTTWRQSYGEDKLRELCRYFAEGAHGKPPGNWAVVWGRLR